jgi:MSHA biogenesis protein MshM
MKFLEFFNLQENPFGDSPDTRFYFPSRPHEAALRKLAWALEEGQSFLLVTGEVGAGKTLLSRMIHSVYEADGPVAALVHPANDEKELLAAITRDFGLPSGNGLPELQDFLLAAARENRRARLLLDEAHRLSDACLEFVRLLTNLETERRKLLQVVLFAQPELEARLEMPALRQLHQRIRLHVRIDQLDRADCEAYIRHRLERAGGGNFVRFEPRAVAEIQRLSRGIPRLVNKITELALRFAALEGRRYIEARWITQLPLGEVGVKRPGLLRQFLGGAR